MSDANEYRPWLEAGETELDYYKRRFLEESAEAERLRDRLADYHKCSLNWGKQMNEHMDEIQSLKAVVDRLESDELAYRLSLGYEIPANHGGLLSDGTQPVNGIAQAAWKQYDDCRAENKRLRAMLEAAREAVEEWSEFRDHEAEMTVLAEKIRLYDARDGEP